MKSLIADVNKVCPQNEFFFEVVKHAPGRVSLAMSGSAKASFDGTSMDITFSPTTQLDAEALVTIRIAAMRESLEQIGRFDQQRVRERFLLSFEPKLCRFIKADGMHAGFVLIRPQDGYWLLDHFYILPEHQGKGIGAFVLRQIFADADARHMPIRVGALRGSHSNRFYQRHGFVQVHEAEWDIYYVRQPGTSRENGVSTIR